MRHLQKDTDVNSADGLWQATTRIFGLSGRDLKKRPDWAPWGERARHMALTATISVPIKEKAAIEATLHHPTNLPVAPGIPWN